MQKNIIEPIKQNNRFSVWSVLSIVSLVCGCFTLYKGIDRLTNYYNSDYSSLNKNAWVGGDAYNYIINGTHATAFFVLTAMFVLAAIGLVIVHYVSKDKQIISAPQDQPKNELEDIEANLPQM